MPDSAPLPDAARRERRQQVARMARHPLRLAGESLRALVELARARWALSRLTMAEIERRNAAAQAPGPSRRGADAGLVERVALVLPLVAWRVPWRADCLVQALAAQQWLRAKGVATRITIGADATEAKGFEAHAWLLEGDRAVTGGDVERYTVLFDSVAPQGAKVSSP